MAYCGDDTEDDGDCPGAELEAGETTTDCGAVSLGHDTVTLAHQCVSHVNPFIAVFYRVRVA